MANEFKHKDVGDELTKAEWEGVDTHIANSQAAGDIIYCDGAYWKRLAKGTAGQYLKTGDTPSWDAPAAAAHKASHENGGTDEISVAGLSGLLTDDQHVLDAEVYALIATHTAIATAHHTKYTNAEAKAAAVLAGAITNGETKAPTHDAVFDVKTTADAAQTAAEVAALIATHTDDKSAHQSNIITITFIIDGGGSAITTGQKGHLEIPFACTLTAWTLLADVAGAIVIDIWKDTYANFPPTNNDAMPGAGKEPTIAATNQKAQDTDISDWATVAISAGDILAFNVDSVATITRVTLSLKATKT